MLRPRAVAFTGSIGGLEFVTERSPSLSAIAKQSGGGRAAIRPSVSAARLYWEFKGAFLTPKGVKIPVAVSAFPDDLCQAPRSWAAQAYPRLIHFNRMPKGGHFAAWEQPKALTQELRIGLRSLRCVECELQGPAGTHCGLVLRALLLSAAKPLPSVLLVRASVLGAVSRAAERGTAAPAVSRC
jgi:hypothetical protein